MKAIWIFKLFLVLNFFFYSGTTCFSQEMRSFSLELFDSYISNNNDLRIYSRVSSYNEYLEVLDTLFKSDQKQRIELHRMNEEDNPEKYKKLLQLMKHSDVKNQQALLLLLKRYGWPCSKDINKSFYAWIIVWHADYRNRHEFYPFLKEAKRKNCILLSHYDQLKID